MLNERNNLTENQNQSKVIKFFIVILSLLVSIISFLFIINKIYKNAKYIKSNENIFNSIKIRDILEEETKHSLLTNLTYVSMEGNWKDSQNNAGVSFINFSTNNKMYPTQLYINFRFLHGDSIDNWMTISSIIYTKDIYIDKKNPGLIMFNSDYSNIVEIGKMFKRDKYYKSSSNIELNLTKINSSILGINGLIELNNDFKNETIMYGVTKVDSKNYKKKIKIYTIIISILVILAFIINQIAIKNVNNSTAYAKSLSIITLYNNLVWSGFGCFFHFYLILTDNRAYKYFSFIEAIFFINFSLTDYRFIDILWRLKNKEYLNNFEIFRKRTVRLYLMSYLSLFILLIFVVDLMFNIYLTIFITILTWLPQIIYNSYYYNRTSLPYAYIIINSIFRLFPSLYFFIYKNNFMFIPQKKLIVILNILLMICLIIIMQCQIYKGPRFFLPDKYNINNISLYKTKKELINQIKNLPNECCICLGPLIYNDNEKTINNIKNVAIEEHDNNLNVHNEVLISKNNFSIKNIIINLLRFFVSSFNFFTISNNVFNKEYIITPCNHSFHSKCLEKWFERKKECPFCRNEFDFLI